MYWWCRSVHINYKTVECEDNTQHLQQQQYLMRNYHASTPLDYTIEVLPFCQLPGYSRVLPGLIIPVTGTSNTLYSTSIWAPGTRWFTLEYPGMTPHHPLNHVPWVVFGIYFPRNPFQNENAVSQCLTPHTSLQVRSAGPAAQWACTDRRLI